jgi:hypothetical protein
METQPFSLQSPEAIAKDYGGNKKQIAQAAQMGLVDPTAAVLAGMFIDRMRSAQAQEQVPDQTIAEQVLNPQVAPQQPQMPQGMPQGMPQDMGQAMPMPMPQEMGAPGMQAGQPSAGLEALPVPNEMFGAPGMAGGGLVAFANGGMASRVDEYRKLMGQIPEGEGTAAYREYLKNLPELNRSQRKEDMWTALAQMGFGAAASPSQYPLQAFGQAASATMPFIQQSVAGAREREAGALKSQAELDQMTRAEEIKATEGGVNLYTKEMDREAQLMAARIAAGRKTDLEKYAELSAAAAGGDEKAALMVAGMDKYLEAMTVRDQSYRGEDREAKARLEANKLTDSQLGYGGVHQKTYRDLQREDKANGTNRAEEFKDRIFRKNLDLLTSSGAAQPPAATEQPTTKPQTPPPDPDAVKILKDNPTPKARQQFDSIFGAGAAAKALSQ